MRSDRLQSGSGLPESGAVWQTRVRATQRGWRSSDWLERAALDLLQGCGPVTEPSSGMSPIYLGFPWSAYFDSLTTQTKTLDLPLLRSAWRALRAERLGAEAVVTVCTHPDLPDHVDRLVAVGVTDLFWSGVMPGQTEFAQAPGLRLHPFPALPDPDRPAPQGDGPGGLFVFCREGGNSPELWAAVGAGLIPVVSQDGPALPGSAALWQAATILHDGSQGALAGLSEQLDIIAANPARIAGMRRALAGLWLIYGPDGLVQDVLVCLMAQADPATWFQTPAEARAERAGQTSCLAPLITRLAGVRTLRMAEAALVLQQAGCDLLVGHGGDLVLSSGPRAAAAWRLIALARATLPQDNPILTRFDDILAFLRSRDLLPVRPAERTALSPKGLSGPRRVYLLGPRGQRTPLAYASLQRHLRGRVTFVDQIEAADLVVTGWDRDLHENRAHLAAFWRSGIRPGLVVLSEEPLWDSVWSSDLSSRERTLDCGDGLYLPYQCLNHVNSDIFRFQTLPWFILSDDRFLARYAMLIAGFAARSPQALLEHWQAVPWQVAFVAERREGPEFAVHYPVEGVVGLSQYRSRVAALVPGAHVLRIGQGWPGTITRRQALPDWHLDKLARLHGVVRLCGAYENTLHPNYITEKPFDAFAVGAIPVTLADQGHRLFDLIAPEAMLNTRFCVPDVAAARIAAFVPDLSLAEAWRESAQNLLALCRNLALILTERQRLADACLEELARIPVSGNTAPAP